MASEFSPPKCIFWQPYVLFIPAFLCSGGPVISTGASFFYQDV